jgi:hypothetical protein
MAIPDYRDGRFALHLSRAPVGAPGHDPSILGQIACDLPGRTGVPMSGQILFERDVLPPNASRYMHALENGMRLPEEIWRALDYIGSAKSLVPDDVVPFLIWEYGLEEVTPWVGDSRRVIADGREWQRIRGTNDAILHALNWIDFSPLWIEESANSTWWDLFQFACPEVVTDRRRLEQIIALTRLSKAAHTDLIRIYSPCWDVRVWEMDEHKLDGGGYLDDWSGVWLRPDWPKVSFCRNNLEVVQLPIQPQFWVGDSRTSVGRLTVERGFVVDQHRVDNDEVIDPMFDIAHGDTRESQSLAGTQYDGPYADAPYEDLPYGYNLTVFNTWDPRSSDGPYGDKPYGDLPYGYMPSFQAWETVEGDSEEASGSFLQFNSYAAHNRTNGRVVTFGAGYGDGPWLDAPYADQWPNFVSSRTTERLDVSTITSASQFRSWSNAEAVSEEKTAPLTQFASWSACDRISTSVQTAVGGYDDGPWLDAPYPTWTFEAHSIDIAQQLKLISGAANATVSTTAILAVTTAVSFTAAAQNAVAVALPIKAQLESVGALSAVLVSTPKTSLTATASLGGSVGTKVFVTAATAATSSVNFNAVVAPQTRLSVTAATSLKPALLAKSSITASADLMANITVDTLYPAGPWPDAPYPG